VVVIGTHRRGFMSNNSKCCCNHAPNEEVKIQLITLEDGRRAERHSFNDENGNEIIEIFSEDKRPLKLEKRIVREHKVVVAKETHQTIKDGEVAEVEVKSLYEDAPLQIREHLGIPEHSKVVDGDYVRKDEIGKIVAEGVVAGMQALMENWEVDETDKPVVHHSQPPTVSPSQPAVSAQSIVEKNVSEKKKNDSTINIVMAVILIAQLAFFGYMFFVM